MTASRSGRRASRLLAVVMALSLWSGVAFAQATAEPALKAAFLFNFAKFTEWPADVLPPSAALVLCVADPEVAAALEAAIAGRSIEQHPLAVNRVKLDDPLRDCAVLYVTRLDEGRTMRLLASLRGASVLTVSDSDGFAERGGTIRLLVEDNRMRFVINITSAARSRLQLSSKLLTLAKIIKE